MELFTRNKYYRLYVKIMAAPDCGIGYLEEHHIIPKSLGGDNKKGNRVSLSFRKHFLAHWLLTKCTDGINQKKMLKAFGLMIYNRSRHFTSWQYELAKSAAREGRKGCPSSWKGRTPSEETRHKMRLAKLGKPSSFKGRRHSLEALAKQRSAKLGKICSEEHRTKMAAAKKGNQYRKGQPVSDDTRAKISLSLIGNTRTLGHTHTEATKAKMSISRMGNKYRLGVYPTEATREKLRQSQRAAWVRRKSIST